MTDYGKNITLGCRVELHPRFDLWMRGAKYGVVKHLKSGWAMVKMDHPDVKRLQQVHVEDLVRR